MPKLVSWSQLASAPVRTQDTGGFFCHFQLQGEPPNQTLEFNDAGLFLAVCFTILEHLGSIFQKDRFPLRNHLWFEVMLTTDFRSALCATDDFKNNLGFELRCELPMLAHVRTPISDNCNSVTVLSKFWGALHSTAESKNVARQE